MKKNIEFTPEEEAAVVVALQGELTKLEEIIRLFKSADDKEGVKMTEDFKCHVLSAIEKMDGIR